MKAQIIHIVFICTVLMFVLSSCNPYSGDSIHDMQYAEDKLYIIAKGTTSKAGEIGKSFNIQHSDISHIGIGIVKNKTLQIYHVIDSENQKSALRIENLDDFLNLKTNKTFYYSIWESNMPFSCNIDSIIQKKWDFPIIYDFAFDLNTPDRLYCSEFCATVLNSCQVNTFEPITLKLEVPYKHLLNRDTFVYYPADFFISYDLFNNVYEQQIELD